MLLYLEFCELKNSLEWDWIFLMIVAKLDKAVFVLVMHWSSILFAYTGSLTVLF